VEPEEVALLVQLVRMAVQEHEDALQLGQRVLADLHDGRLVCLNHRHWADGGSRVAAVALGSSAGGWAFVVIRVQGRRRLGKAR
jgi:hypothetical protein